MAKKILFLWARELEEDERAGEQKTHWKHNNKQQQKQQTNTNDDTDNSKDAHFANVAIVVLIFFVVVRRCFFISSFVIAFTCSCRHFLYSVSIYFFSCVICLTGASFLP